MTPVTLVKMNERTVRGRGPAHNTQRVHGKNVYTYSSRPVLNNAITLGRVVVYTVRVKVYI